MIIGIYKVFGYQYERNSQNYKYSILIDILIKKNIKLNEDILIQIKKMFKENYKYFNYNLMIFVIKLYLHIL